jgi:predicted hydrocarbon binding protein
LSDISTEKQTITDESHHVPVFGYELLREVLIPELLGKETSEILYWAGKRIARKYPLQSMEEIFSFFQSAGWGTLVIKKEAKNELDLELTSRIITERLKTNNECSFQLEAGFLAQQMEQMNGVISEAYEHPRKRGGKIMFTIKWDKKDVTTDK